MDETAPCFASAEILPKPAEETDEPVITPEYISNTLIKSGKCMFRGLQLFGKSMVALAKYVSKEVSDKISETKGE